MNEFYAVVLAGGSGTRFWPASRKLRPKQLLSITPGSDQTLIEQTVRRIESLATPERTLIATGRHLIDGTKRALPWLPPESFLGEPLAKNTAPCIAWATALIHAKDPEALVMVLPSDQHVSDNEAYLCAIQLALESAKQGNVTTVGLTPTRPETGYGYIQAGSVGSEGVRRVERFVEKPDKPTAQKYLASDDYYWNAGMFFFRASVMKAALERFCPSLWTAMAAIANSPGDASSLVQSAFSEAESVSIDYAVMEKLDDMRVVPADFGWSDVGSWEVAWELGDKDAQGNVCPEGTVLVDAARNLTRDLRTSKDQNRVIALVGVDDLCVIETDDAIWIIPRVRSQDVRAAVDVLKARGSNELL